MNVKIRDGHVADRPVCLAVGVDLDGAKYWAGVLAELTNRGAHDVLIVCCDGLRGLPESIRATWPDATVQTR